jgi:hypothetical protein
MSQFFVELLSLIMLKNKKTTDHIVAFGNLFNLHFTNLFQSLPLALGEAIRNPHLRLTSYSLPINLVVWGSRSNSLVPLQSGYNSMCCLFLVVLVL